MSTVTKDNNQDDENTTDEKTVLNLDENANDDETTHGLSLKKKIGKFRCLSDENENLDLNQDSTPPSINKQSFQSSTLLPQCVLNDTLQTTTTMTTNETKKVKSARKKPAPKSKDDDIIVNRRRSTRLKTLEEKKDVNENLENDESKEMSTTSNTASSTTTENTVISTTVNLNDELINGEKEKIKN